MTGMHKSDTKPDAQGAFQLFIVDDDSAIRDALSVIFNLEGFVTSLFENGDNFLGAVKDHKPDAVIMDVHMPGRSGLDVLHTLDAHHFSAPIFIISGQGDIPMAVEAVKAGAYDFIEKPFDADKIVDQMRDAIAKFKQKNDQGMLTASFPGNDILTPRELDVVNKIVKGQSNREAASELGISSRTVEVHRARIMDKLGAKNAADLVRIVMSG